MRDKNNSSRPPPQVYRRRVMSGVSASHLATPRAPAFCTSRMVLRQPSRLLQMGTAFHLCLVGASHSHRLTEAENPYEEHSERYRHIIRLQSDTHRNPLSQRCGPGSLSRLQAPFCDAAVIVSGQRSTGYSGGRPTYVRSCYLERQSPPSSLSDLAHP